MNSPSASPARGSLVDWAAHGELAVIRPATNADDSQIEVFRPVDLAARVAEAGLGSCAHIANRGQWRHTRETILWFGWPTLLAFIAFYVVSSSSLERFRYGQAMPAGLARDSRAWRCRCRMANDQDAGRFRSG